jgi:hypothetical protein
VEEEVGARLRRTKRMLSGGGVKGDAGLGVGGNVNGEKSEGRPMRL